MRNYILGVATGTVLGYVFRGNIDQALRVGLAKANEVVDTTPPVSS